MRTPVRARIAAALLVIAPSLALLASLAPVWASPLAASSLRIASLAAWLPSIAVLEHFLKRRTELGSLLISGVATLGTAGGIVASTLELARDASRSSAGTVSRALPAWIELAASAVPLLLPLGLALCGVAWMRFRVAPRSISIAFIVGGVLGATIPECWVPGVTLLGNAVILVACVGVALCMSRVPDAWRDAVLLRV